MEPARASWQTVLNSLMAPWLLWVLIKGPARALMVRRKLPTRLRRQQHTELMSPKKL